MWLCAALCMASQQMLPPPLAHVANGSQLQENGFRLHRCPEDRLLLKLAAAWGMKHWHGHCLPATQLANELFKPPMHVLSAALATPVSALPACPPPLHSMQRLPPCLAGDRPAPGTIHAAPDAPLSDSLAVSAERSQAQPTEMPPTCASPCRQRSYFCEDCCLSLKGCQ